jgi:hypothetical protein
MVKFISNKGNAKHGVSPHLKIWHWKSIGFQILLRTKNVPSLVKIHWRMLILECSQGYYGRTVALLYPFTIPLQLRWWGDKKNNKYSKYENHILFIKSKLFSGCFPPRILFEFSSGSHNNKVILPFQAHLFVELHVLWFWFRLPVQTDHDVLRYQSL